jgi:phage replication initiation protein
MHLDSTTQSAPCHYVSPTDPRIVDALREPLYAGRFHFGPNFVRPAEWARRVVELAEAVEPAAEWWVDGLVGGAEAHPLTNRGAPVAEIVDHIHWIELTEPHNEPEKLIILCPEGLDWVELPRGMNGYDQCISAPGFKIMWDGRADMGSHLVISGEGCEHMAEFLNGDWQGWLSMVAALGYKVTRCDVARDEFTGLLDIGELRQAWNDHAVTSLWSKINDQASYEKGSGGQASGRTLRFGSPKSDCTANIYDKAAEMASRLPEEERAAFLTDHGHHIRVELRLRRDQAQAAVRAICEHGLGVIPEIIRRYLDFKVDDTRNYKTSTRVPTLPAWEAFLQGAVRRVLRVGRKVLSLAAAKEWLRKYIAPSLAAVVEAEGGDRSWLWNTIKHEDRHLRKTKYLNMMQEESDRWAA